MKATTPSAEEADVLSAFDMARVIHWRNWIKTNGLPDDINHEVNQFILYIANTYSSEAISEASRQLNS